jgi:transposase, IS6 family
MGHKKNIPIDVSRGTKSRKKGKLRGLRSVLPRSSSGGAVAFVVTAFERRDCWHENPPPARRSSPRSAVTGFRFPSAVIVLAVRWYLRLGLSSRDVEELLTKRGVQVDHVTIDRWVQRFTPLLAEAARPCRQAVGDRWFVDQTR